ncbi:MAG: hypothetical protein Q8R28_14995 [Dehalococcoidia bacterium]|nr:hypothetical protein [Dehalococcoidia bacterium]
MIQVAVDWIVPDDETEYLMGPEGLVWVQPAFDEPHIVAARDGLERDRAARYIGSLLQMGLVPYGLPLNQRVNIALFGGGPLRDCTWVRHADAPAPAGDAHGGEGLPTKAAIVSKQE